MPTTVPNRPMNGAVEPTVARKARPSPRRAPIAPRLRWRPVAIQPGRAVRAGERRGRTDGREEGGAFTEARADRTLAALEAVGHPVVLVDRVGELAVLL